MLYLFNYCHIIELYMNAVFSYVLDANEDGEDKHEDDALSNGEGGGGWIGFFFERIEMSSNDTK